MLSRVQNLTIMIKIGEWLKMSEIVSPLRSIYNMYSCEKLKFLLGRGSFA